MLDTMDIICKTCGKKLGDWNKHGAVAMKKRAKSFDMHYFCKEGDCLKKYEEELYGD